MKKLNLIILFVSLFTIVTNAQETVDSFSNAYWNKDLTIEASLENNNIKSVYLQVEAKDAKSAYISIDGKNVETFKASLKLVRDKYLNWIKVAKDNNITDMDKEFDISFPRATVVWSGSKWWFSFNNRIRMIFLILDNGKMIALWNPKVTSSSNKYIDETIYFVFSCEEDFNELISKLDSQAILDKLTAKKNNEDLFQ